MHYSGHWRDKQLTAFVDIKDHEILLAQEMVMLNFVMTKPNVRWFWQAPASKFRDFCAKRINLVQQDYDGIIFFGFRNCDTKTLVAEITTAIAKVKYAYVGLNRYQIKKHNLDIPLPDSIEDSLDCLVRYCDPRFQRLHKFKEVDGNHMVFSHPMDCYGLCK